MNGVSTLKRVAESLLPLSALLHVRIQGEIRHLQPEEGSPRDPAIQAP